MSANAVLENGRKPMAVATIAPSRSRMSASAAAGQRRPKNNPDQVQLSPNWTKNKTIAYLLLLQPALRHTSQAAIAMDRYSTDHTGAKIQPGGVSAGLRNCAYQVFTDERVHTDPIAATPKQAARKNRSMSQLCRAMCAFQ